MSTQRITERMLGQRGTEEGARLIARLRLRLVDHRRDIDPAGRAPAPPARLPGCGLAVTMLPLLTRFLASPAPQPSRPLPARGR